MKEPITRRSLLKGCAALSLGSVLSPLDAAFSLSQNSSKHMAGASTLYLCFHGLFAFVFREDDILILTPRIDEHKFLAGGWRNEKALKKGESYSLLPGTNKSGHSNPRPVVGQDNLHLSGIKNIDAGAVIVRSRCPFLKSSFPCGTSQPAFPAQAMPLPMQFRHQISRSFRY